MENTMTVAEMNAELSREEEARQVAQTTIDQINTLDFWARARWGVKQALFLGADGSAMGVQFNCNRGIKIRILLENDTYTIEIGRLRGMNYTKKDDASDVYAEDLVRIIDGMFSKAFGAL